MFAACIVMFCPMTFVLINGNDITLTTEPTQDAYNENGTIQFLCNTSNAKFLFNNKSGASHDIKITNHTNNSITIQLTWKINGVKVQCRSLSTKENETSNILNLNILYKPRIEVLATKTIEKFAGDTLKLDCKYDANPSENAAVTWYRNSFLLSKQTTAKLVISDLKLTDAGNYRCIVTNSEGHAVQSIEVYIKKSKNAAQDKTTSPPNNAGAEVSLKALAVAGGFFIILVVVPVGFCFRHRVAKCCCGSKISKSKGSYVYGDDTSGTHTDLSERSYSVPSVSGFSEPLTRSQLSDPVLTRQDIAELQRQREISDDKLRGSDRDVGQKKSATRSRSKERESSKKTPSVEEKKSATRSRSRERENSKKSSSTDSKRTSPKTEEDGTGSRDKNRKKIKKRR